MQRFINCFIFDAQSVTSSCFYTNNTIFLRHFLLILIVAPCFGLAQGLIKGIVTDTSNAPVPYCSLALLKASDSSNVKGNVTDENGIYVYEKIPNGRYLLKFSCVGFKAGWSEAFDFDSVNSVEIPSQVLKREGITLQEVSVAAFRPTVEFKSGTIVMNVENNIISGGNTVFELLKRMPGITVDAQNNISVNGRGGVRFMFDGRLQQIPTAQLINMLMGMPAENVSSIELIKNPPAKYDAAGTGDLINIIMKKAKVKGFSGSLSQSGSHGDQWRGGTFGSLNYKSNRFTVFSNFHFGYFHFQTNNYFYRRIVDSANTFEAVSQGQQDPLRLMLNGNAGLEYEISKNTVLGANLNFNWAHITNAEHARLAITNGNVFPYNYINFDINTIQWVNNPGYNVNLNHKFDTLTKLSISADYVPYLEDISRFTSNRYLNTANSEVIPSNQFGTIFHNDFNIYTQKADLTREFRKKFSLETGFKSSFVSNSSNSTVMFSDTNGVLIADATFSNRYRYQERILAGYLTLAKSYRKVEVRAGMRTEHTLADGSNETHPFTLHRDYINFFPSGSIDYKISEKHVLQANYSYRIGRPSYDQLNPARTFNDRFSNGAGNPQLKPQFIHATGIDYNFNNMFTFSLSWQRMLNVIYYYSYGDPKTKVNKDSIFNFNRIDNASAGLFFQKQWKRINFNTFAGGFFRDNATIVNGLSVRSQAFVGYSNGTLEIMLPKEVKIQLQGFWESYTTDGVQSYYPIGVANFTIFRSFFHKHLDISFSVFDIFYTDRRPYENRVGGQYTYYRERNDTRRLRGFIVWKFGKMRINQQNKPEQDSRLKKVG